MGAFSLIVVINLLNRFVFGLLLSFAKVTLQLSNFKKIYILLKKCSRMGGNFLSQPKRDGPGECDTDKENNVSYGVIGLQGWRTSMEDAHLCIPGLKRHILDRLTELKVESEVIQNVPDCSLFAVFDGHGGAEVARLCSEKFVQFLLAEESFLSGDYETALKHVFLKLDQFVISEDGQKLLLEIIEKIKEEDATSAVDDDGCEENGDEEEVDGEEDGDDDDDKDAEGDDDADLDGADAEGVGMLINSLMGNGFMQFLSKRTQQMHRELAQLGEDEDDDEDFDPDEVQGDEDDSSEDADDNQEDSEEEGETDEEGEEADESEECGKKEEDATSKSPKKPTASANGDESKTEKSDEEQVNTLEEVNDASEDANGIDKMKEEDNKAEVKQEIKEEGNSSGIATGDSMNADETAEKVNKSPERKCAKQVNGDCNEENSHDKNGESKAPLGDQSKFVKEDASEDETLLGDDYLDDNLMQKPGYDSGCTAVVALKVNSKVYVANAGDSRCVL